MVTHLIWAIRLDSSRIWPASSRLSMLRLITLAMGNRNYQMWEKMSSAGIFSLGTYPVTVNAAKYKIKAAILQCPIGSLSCMFYDEY